MKTRVGFVGNVAIANQFKDSEFIEVVYNVDDGANAVELQQQTNAEVVVTDIMIPGMDGFTLLTQLGQLTPAPRRLVLTELKSEVFVLKAYELGVSQYLLRPYNTQALIDAIKRPSAKARSSMGKNDLFKTLDEKLSNIFISVGIPAHIKGYQFLREGIKLAVDNPSIINTITKGLYPTIATRFETSSSKVERAIRHAIEVAWNRGRIENINSLFGVKVYSSNEKPTNGEFIALLADKMLLECAY
ncbi:MAG: sporulation transcription factor Spo0A [Clostridia bacterium]